MNAQDKVNACAASCQYEYEADLVSFMYDIEPADNGGREYPSTPAHISVMYISFDGKMWQHIDIDLGEELDLALMESAAESHYDNY